MHSKSQIKFIIYFLSVFSVLFIMLFLLGLVPENLKSEEGDSFRTLWDKTQSELISEQKTKDYLAIKTPAEEPTRIVISKIGVDTNVANPNTTNIKTLDDYLLQGAVRYPGSGLIGEGNMFIFAHSTGYAVVHNQAFKAFNGLKNLVSGDLINVYSGSKIYTYKVRTVKLVDESQALVELSRDKNMLTLSTCNSFGAKSERYVVEADFIE